MVKLGDEVRDKISGFKGIATGSAQYLYGCLRIQITPNEKSKNRKFDTIWIDEPQLEVIKKGVLKATPIGPSGPQKDDMR